MRMCVYALISVFVPVSAAAGGSVSLAQLEIR